MKKRQSLKEEAARRYRQEFKTVPTDYLARSWQERFAITHAIPKHYSGAELLWLYAHEPSLKLRKRIVYFLQHSKRNCNEWLDIATQRYLLLSGKARTRPSSAPLVKELVTKDIETSELPKEPSSKELDCNLPFEGDGMRRRYLQMCIKARREFLLRPENITYELSLRSNKFVPPRIDPHYYEAPYLCIESIKLSRSSVISSKFDFEGAMRWLQQHWDATVQEARGPARQHKARTDMLIGLKYTSVFLSQWAKRHPRQVEALLITLLSFASGVIDSVPQSTATSEPTSPAACFKSPDFAPVDIAYELAMWFKDSVADGFGSLSKKRYGRKIAESLRRLALHAGADTMIDDVMNPELQAYIPIPTDIACTSPSVRCYWTLVYESALKHYYNGHLILSTNSPVWWYEFDQHERPLLAAALFGEVRDSEELVCQFNPARVSAISSQWNLKDFPDNYLLQSRLPTKCHKWTGDKIRESDLAACIYPGLRYDLARIACGQIEYATKTEKYPSVARYLPIIKSDDVTNGLYAQNELRESINSNLEEDRKAGYKAIGTLIGDWMADDPSACMKVERHRIWAELHGREESKKVMELLPFRQPPKIEEIPDSVVRICTSLLSYALDHIVEDMDPVCQSFISTLSRQLQANRNVMRLFISGANDLQEKLKKFIYKISIASDTFSQTVESVISLYNCIACIKPSIFDLWSQKVLEVFNLNPANAYLDKEAAERLGVDVSSEIQYIVNKIYFDYNEYKSLKASSAPPSVCSDTEATTEDKILPNISCAFKTLADVRQFLEDAADVKLTDSPAKVRKVMNTYEYMPCFESAFPYQSLKYSYQQTVLLDFMRKGYHNKVKSIILQAPAEKHEEKFVKFKFVFASGEEVTESITPSVAELFEHLAHLSASGKPDDWLMDRDIAGWICKNGSLSLRICAFRNVWLLQTGNDDKCYKIEERQLSTEPIFRFETADAIKCVTVNKLTEKKPLGLTLAEIYCASLKELAAYCPTDIQRRIAVSQIFSKFSLHSVKAPKASGTGCHSGLAKAGEFNHSTLVCETKATGEMTWENPNPNPVYSNGDWLLEWPLAQVYSRELHHVINGVDGKDLHFGKYQDMLLVHEDYLNKHWRRSPMWIRHSSGRWWANTEHTAYYQCRDFEELRQFFTLTGTINKFVYLDNLDKLPGLTFYRRYSEYLLQMNRWCPKQVESANTKSSMYNVNHDAVAWTTGNDDDITEILQKGELPEMGYRRGYWRILSKADEGLPAPEYLSTANKAVRNRKAFHLYILDWRQLLMQGNLEKIREWVDSHKSICASQEMLGRFIYAAVRFKGPRSHRLKVFELLMELGLNDLQTVYKALRKCRIAPGECLDLLANERIYEAILLDSHEFWSKDPPLLQQDEDYAEREREAERFLEEEPADRLGSVILRKLGFSDVFNSLKNLPQHPVDAMKERGTPDLKKMQTADGKVLVPLLEMYLNNSFYYGRHVVSGMPFRFAIQVAETVYHLDGRSRFRYWRNLVPQLSNLKLLPYYVTEWVPKLPLLQGRLSQHLRIVLELLGKLGGSSHSVNCAFAREIKRVDHVLYQAYSKFRLASQD